MIDLPPPAEISLERSLGKGERAEIFLARGGRFAIKRYFTQDQISFPAKELIPYQYDENGMFLGAQRELDVAQRLIHPNVIRIHSMFFDGTTTYLVMDFVDGRTLDDMQEKTVLLQAARDVIDVLRLALNEGLIHHDLHSENFVLDRLGKIYFIDLDSFDDEEGDEDWDEYADHIYTFIHALLRFDTTIPTKDGLQSKEDLAAYLDELKAALSS